MLTSGTEQINRCKIFLKYSKKLKINKDSFDKYYVSLGIATMGCLIETEKLVLKEECIFGIKEYANLKNINKSTIHRRINNGKMNRITIGGRSFIYDESMKRKDMKILKEK